MADISRIMRLAGLKEAMQVEDPDEVDRHDDERRAREVRIQRLIAFAFRKLGLAIGETNDGQPTIYYDEDQEREAVVTLDDSEVALALLVKLPQSGLGQNYVIGADRGQVTVTFTVSDALDHVRQP